MACVSMRCFTVDICDEPDMASQISSLELRQVQPKDPALPISLVTLTVIN